MEGDGTHMPGGWSPGNFYPRPPHGGRPAPWQCFLRPKFISIHALRMEGDLYNAFTRACVREISIHALRMEGDVPVHDNGRVGAVHFYPRPPHGGRLTLIWPMLFFWIFLSTPSAWRATAASSSSCSGSGISIHALRMEGDRQNVG